MRPTARIYQIAFLIPLALALISCGGGGSSTTTAGSSSSTNHAPSVTAITYSPAGASSGHVTEYASYTFTATASDPDLGDTIAKVEWDFLGAGSATSGAGTTASVSYAYSKVGTFAVRARATDGRGLTGDWSSPLSVTVDTATSPLTTTLTQPTTAQILTAPLGGSATLTYYIHVANTGTGTISASGVSLDPGDSNASAGTAVSVGSGDWTVPVTYNAASSTGSRTATATISVADSNGVSSASITGPVVTINTTATSSTAPVIAITTPTSTTPSVYTSKPVSLVFTLTQTEGYALSYTIDWGDGNTDSGTTGTASTASGVSITAPSHTYADTFTSSSATAVVKITATTNIAGGTNSLTRNFTVLYNTPPTATITAPELSGYVPTGYSSTSTPDYTVVPNGGILTFAGTGTHPASGDAISYHWTFPGGTPSSYDGQNPGTVVFAGTGGVITPCSVVLTVTDAFSRSVTATRKVLIDGMNTQTFTLAFKYRTIASDGSRTLKTVVTSANGLDTQIKIFQDGQTSTYAVNDSTGMASVGVPVRSDLPFYVQIPTFGSVDTNSYILRIPNAPSGSYADSSLVTPDSLKSSISSFYFSNTSAPWNPILDIVTAQGFADETDSAPLRTLNGNTDLVLGNAAGYTNERWLDRLSVPLNDSLTSAITWTQSSNAVGQLSGVAAYQHFAEWPILMLTRPTAKLDASDTTSAGTNTDMACLLDYATYSADSATSKTFAAFTMQAFRVPAGVTDPYQLSSAGWQNSTAELDSTYSNPSAGLNPTHLSSSDISFINSVVNTDPGSTAFAGGIKSLPLPYDPNDQNRTPLATPGTRTFDSIRKVFSYAEYLWTSVWARPLVLNSAHPNYLQSSNLSAFSYFRYSNPSYWPSYTGITATTLEGVSSFNLAVTGGASFTASSPVGSATLPLAGGVGRFYWTAFTPSYTGEASSGSAISRTWLSTDTGGFPTTFSPPSSTDPVVGFGFMTPQDTMVDKRGRDAQGQVTGATSGGYRVTWYNPTKDASGNPVPPDFWVVEIKGSSTVHFMLPGSFPATQSTTDGILTDARTYLPSGSTTLQTGDTVAPGYCWFDVPSDLRPTSSASITVFAVRSILKNNPVASARALNRPDWVDAIKTVTSNMQMKTSSGRDLSYAHKIPFNYCWDIVVANGPATAVEP